MTSTNPLKTVLIAAGGTGGHVFPALAVAQLLQQQGVKVEWIGTQKGLEAQIVPAAGITLHFIPIGGLRGKGLMTLLKAPWNLTKALYHARQIIKNVRPDIVLGMGGFVSGPAGIAAWLARKPLVIHEQNAIAGFTNKILARFAKRVLQAFPGTFPTNYQAITTGNPLRADITTITKPAHNTTRPLRILVLGGSLGATAINQLIPQTLALWPDHQTQIEIRHQTGQKHLETTQAQYQNHNVTAELLPFISNMAEAYTWADLAICRSGALTVSELAAVGLPSILIPFPHAVDDHQTHNGNYLVKAGAAVMVQQKELTAEGLSQLLQELAGNRDMLVAMAKAAWGVREVDAAEMVIKQCS